jgi:SAM-dependent methyltransferase
LAKLNDDQLSEQVSFQLGSVYELPFPDKSFDVVFAHQVVIHLEFPEKGLNEMARVAKKVVLVKDSDTASIVVYPDVYQDVLSGYFNRSKSGFTKQKAGRSLKGTAIKAGYDAKRITSSASVWNVSNDEDRVRWADMVLARIESSGELDSCSPEEVESYKEAWRNWKTDEAGWLTILHGEIAYFV